MTHPYLSKRPLGRTGLVVTPLGFGGGWIGSRGSHYSDAQAVATVLRALESGLDLIDTSGGYGDSERRIGLALESWYRNGGCREDIVLSTKTGSRTHPHDYSSGATLKSVDESRRLLKSDWLDILMIHDPADLEPALAPGGALPVLLRLKKQGVIRAVGLGVRAHEFHRRCLATGLFDVSLTYLDYNLLRQAAAEGVFPAAEKAGAGVFNGTSFANGLLNGIDPLETAARHNWPADRPEVQRARALWEFAGERGFSLIALNLQFCMRQKRIASTLLGASGPSEIEADLQAASEPIPDSVWTELEERFGIPGSGEGAFHAVQDSGAER